MKSKILAVFALSLSLSSCTTYLKNEPPEKNPIATSNDIISQSMNEEEIEENTEEEISESIPYETRDGEYSSNLSSETDGERFADNDIGNMTKLTLNENTLEIDGSIAYREKTDNWDNAEYLDNEKYYFEIDPDTVYVVANHTAEPTYYERDDFINQYEEFKSSGLTFIVTVEESKAIEVRITN